jgi:hypothetical protein
MLGRRIRGAPLSVHENDVSVVAELLHDPVALQLGVEIGIARDVDRLGTSTGASIVTRGRPCRTRRGCLSGRTGPSPLDRVGLAPSRQGGATSVRPIRLGFLGCWPFRCENPQ